MTAVNVYDGLLLSMDIETGPWSKGLRGQFYINTLTLDDLCVCVLSKAITLIWLARLDWDNTGRILFEGSVD